MSLSPLIKFSALALAVVAAACAPAPYYRYAPPIRTLAAGSPGRVPTEHLEVGGGIASAVPEVFVGFAPLDWMELRAGASMGLMGPGGFQMTYLGSALHSEFADESGDLRFVQEAEIGGGAGTGTLLISGGYDDVASGLQAQWKGAAAGMYGGLALGGHIHWFSIWLRGRGEVVWSERVQHVTRWVTPSFGLGFRMGGLVHLMLGGGFAWGGTGDQSTVLPSLEAALSAVWDVVPSEQ